ncbi:single-stranded DNA-binding protein [Cellulomonas cellasea]|uniref:Single-strand DNA-binding protein n=1 Tax=Cellulomonas cellasea TaxID=43670 RepID=A0A7W4YD68_9CELL|nr:single-stranded DNA-binding protein [Cellulomonas cellasea]MBB2924924.1 single-strand DNA-binding protein [Cellulomonas cellasea]
MSTNELTLTLVGWLGTDPKHYPGTSAGAGGAGGAATTTTGASAGAATTSPPTAGGTSTPFTTFRMASTRRWFDRERGTWVDGRTEWFTVKAWRGAARNVAESLRKGDPVLVHGRLSTDEWSTADGEPRTSLVLDAIAIGPDLAFGTARYMRTIHSSTADPAADSAGDEARDGDGHDALDDVDASDAALYALADVRPDEDLALTGTR